jgi:putative FmdB family regulatory protein
MPIYEYKCRKCGVFESIQKISDAPLKKCPTCKGKVEKLISQSSFVLKGSGWYATDYAKKSTASEPTPAASESTSTPAASSTPAADTSTKPSSSTEKSTSKAAN